MGSRCEVTKAATWQGARQRPPQTHSLQYVEEAGVTRLRVAQPGQAE